MHSGRRACDTGYMVLHPRKTQRSRVLHETLIDTHLVEKFPSFLCNTQVQYSIQKHLSRNIVSFYGEELLALRPTPKLDYHPLSAVLDCLFNIFAATFHIWRSFFYPQPESGPCSGERDLLVMVLPVHKSVPFLEYSIFYDILCTVN